MEWVLHCCMHVHSGVNLHASLHQPKTLKNFFLKINFKISWRHALKQCVNCCHNHYKICTSHCKSVVHDYYSRTSHTSGGSFFFYPHFFLKNRYILKTWTSDLAKDYSKAQKKLHYLWAIMIPQYDLQLYEKLPPIHCLGTITSHFLWHCSEIHQVAFHI